MQINKIYKKSENGFTLVEVLIAVVIFSIIMLSLFSSFRLFISSTHIIKEKLSEVDQIMGVFKQIRADIETIFILQPPRYSKPLFDSEPDPYGFKGSDSKFRFSSFNNTHYSQGFDKGIVKLVYYLRPCKNNDNFDLCRKQIFISDSDPQSESETSCYDPVVIQQIAGIKISYIDFNGDAHDFWDSESSEYEYKFPAAVSFELTLIGKDRKTKIESSISLPVKRISPE